MSLLLESLRPFEATASLQTPLVRFLLAPLEIPKLANAQPSNFGPLPYFITALSPQKKLGKVEAAGLSRKFLPCNYRLQHSSGLLFY